MALLDNLPDVLDANDIAKVLRISRSSVYAGLKNGSIPCVRIGSKSRIAKIAFIAWLNRDPNFSPAGKDGLK